MDFAFLNWIISCNAPWYPWSNMMVLRGGNPHPAPQFAQVTHQIFPPPWPPPEPPAEEFEASQAATPRPAGLGRGLRVTCKNPNPFQ